MSATTIPSSTPSENNSAPFKTASGDRKIFFTLDGIRGLAAILVVLRHAEVFFNPWAAQESYLAVDIFFALSGVVIAQAYGQRLLAGMTTARFTWIRIVRIFPLYILGSAISVVALLSGLTYLEDFRAVFLYVGLGLFMLPDLNPGAIEVFPLNGPAWTLPLEMIVNVFYAVFLRRLNILTITLIMAISAGGLAFIALKSSSHSLNVGFWAKSFPFGLFRVFYSFFAGITLYHYLPNYNKWFSFVNWHETAAWGILVCVAFALLSAPPTNIQWMYDLSLVLFVFPCLIGCAMVIQPRGVTARIFRFLGLTSYAIYTLHGPLAALSAGALKKYADIDVARSAPWSGGLFLVFIIVLSFVIDKNYDFPIRRYLLKLSSKKNSTW